MRRSPGSAHTNQQVQHSRGTSDKARNEKQKAWLLEDVAKQLSHTAAELCAASRQLVAEGKTRIARARKLIGGA